MLVIKCFNREKPSHEQFIKFIKGVKNDIFEPGEVPGNVDGTIHALCLQLVANGIVDMKISDAGRSLIGTNQLEAKHVVVQLGVESSGMPALFGESNWKGMTFVPQATPVDVKLK